MPQWTSEAIYFFYFTLLIGVMEGLEHIPAVRMKDPYNQALQVSTLVKSDTLNQSWGEFRCKNSGWELKFDIDISLTVCYFS